MSMREREDVEGGNESCVNIDGESKKINKWKSLKEMKEYLSSEFEKKTEMVAEEKDYDECFGGETYLHFAAYLGDVDATKMLIEDNSDVNAVEKNKLTPLHLRTWQVPKYIT